MKVDQLPLDVFDSPDDQSSPSRAVPETVPRKKNNVAQKKCLNTAREGGREHSEWEREHSEEESDDEGHEVVFYEEVPQEGMPELVELVPREMGGRPDIREPEVPMEQEARVNLANSDSEMADPGNPDPISVESDSDPDLLENGEEENAEPVVHDSINSDNNLETSEPDADSEQEDSEDSEEEDSEGSPVVRRSARARIPKKVFSYNTKGQPIWEKT